MNANDLEARYANAFERYSQIGSIVMGPKVNEVQAGLPQWLGGRLPGGFEHDMGAAQNAGDMAAIVALAERAISEIEAYERRIQAWLDADMSGVEKPHIRRMCEAAARKAGMLD